MTGGGNKTLALVMGVVGAALLVCVVFLVAKSWQANDRAQEESAMVMSQLTSQIPSLHAPARGLDADRAMPSIMVDGRAYLGYVIAEAANIELPVALDYSEDLLDVVPCRIGGDVATGDLVICGRRQESQFGSLEQVSIGDDVTLVMADGTMLEYVVSNLETVDADDVDYMLSNRNNSDSPADWELTLFTGLIDSRRCLAVRCERV